MHKYKNSDKCFSFLSGTSHVADSALRQVHVTAGKQAAKESHADGLSPVGEKRKIKSQGKMCRERERVRGEKGVSAV